MGRSTLSCLRSLASRLTLVLRWKTLITSSAFKFPVRYGGTWDKVPPL